MLNINYSTKRKVFLVLMAIGGASMIKFGGISTMFKPLVEYQLMGIDLGSVLGAFIVVLTWLIYKKRFG